MIGSSGLRSVVEELTTDHYRTARGGQRQEISGYEEALLSQLQQSITSDSGAGSARGVDRTGNVMNLSAMEMWRDICADLREFSPSPVIDPRAKLQAWAASVRGTLHEGHLLDRCLRWRDDIRELLDPVKRIPMTGARCPMCLAEWLKDVQPDGTDVVWKPVLLATAVEGDARVDCLACGAEWSRGEMLDLRARLHVG